MYVISYNTRDYPGMYVLRIFDCTNAPPTTPTEPEFVGVTVKDCHGKLPHGAYLLPKNVNDDPVILETWV